MSEFYGKTNDDVSKITIKKAYELGVNHFDTADVYGSGHNETLLGETINELGCRDRVAIATKCGLVRNNIDGTFMGINGTIGYIKKSCEASLKRLKVDYIDLYYLHRLDPNTPIEISMQALSELVKEGKVRHIGLSSVGPDTIQAAHKIHPLTAIQSEYSILTRDVELDVLPLCKKLNIGFVACSPVGNGFLTGKISSIDQFAQNDSRRLIPRFQDENIAYNLKIIDILKDVGFKKGCTPVQVELAWLLAQGDNITAIPGTRASKHLEENLASVNIELSKEELVQLNQEIPLGFTKGDGLPKEFSKFLNNYEPAR